jgi:hypothetical protein
MTTSGTAGTRELDRTGSQAESTGKLVCWLSVFVFGAGCVTVELIHDLHRKAPKSGGTFQFR